MENSSGNGSAEFLWIITLLTKPYQDLTIYTIQDRTIISIAEIKPELLN